MNRKQNLVLILLAWAGGVSAFSAQPLVWSDADFDVIGDQGWVPGSGGNVQRNSSQQLVITENSFGAAQTNDLIATGMPAAYNLPGMEALRDLQALELRADLISANQNGAFAGITLNWTMEGGMAGWLS